MVVYQALDTGMQNSVTVTLAAILAGVAISCAAMVNTFFARFAVAFFFALDALTMLTFFGQTHQVAFTIPIDAASIQTLATYANLPDLALAVGRAGAVADTLIINAGFGRVTVLIGLAVNESALICETDLIISTITVI